MWKSTAGHTIISNSNPLSKKIIAENLNDPDDWDTDPDFIVCMWLVIFDLKNIRNIINCVCLCCFFKKNTVSEKEQRWGSKTIQGSGRLDSVE